MKRFSSQGRPSAGLIFILGFSAAAAFSQKTGDSKILRTNGYEIQVLKQARVQSWKDPLFADNDMFPRFQAQPGNEVAVFTVSFKRLEPEAKIKLEKMFAVDDAGKEHDSPIIAQSDLDDDSIIREFAFGVPVGTVLVKLKLTKDIVLDVVQ